MQQADRHPRGVAPTVEGARAASPGRVGPSTLASFDDRRASTAAQRRLIEGMASSPAAATHKARLAALRDGPPLAQRRFAPVQRLVYFTDAADGAQATDAKPTTYPHWESPLNGTEQTLHDTAAGARAAAVGALGVDAESPSATGVKYSSGGPAANGTYEFWVDKAHRVKGHPVHEEDDTNSLTRVTKKGKKEARREFRPVVHDHAADYGPQGDKAWDLTANPGAKYDKAAGAMDHYLQKPALG